MEPVSGSTKRSQVRSKNPNSGIPLTRNCVVSIRVLAVRPPPRPAPGMSAAGMTSNADAVLGGATNNCVTTMTPLPSSAANSEASRPPLVPILADQRSNAVDRPPFGTPDCVAVLGPSRLPFGASSRSANGSRGFGRPCATPGFGGAKRGGNAGDRNPPGRWSSHRNRWSDSSEYAFCHLNLDDPVFIPSYSRLE